MHQNNELKSLAPIALFVYNRPEHTRQTIEALQKNTLATESELFIFSDGPKTVEVIEKVDEVRKYLKTITGFKNVTIVEKKENIGLANSIIAGVTEIVNKHGKVVVVEDDLVTSPFFLEYMNDGLNLYENENKVASIHGYVYPVKQQLPETFFLRGADCWGWATWKRAWDLFEPDGQKLLKQLEQKNLVKQFDLDNSFFYSTMLKRQIEGKNNSWAIRWHASCFLADKLTLYPGISLVKNIGQDTSGTHKGDSRLQGGEISANKIEILKIDTKENMEARRVFVQYFESLKPSIITRIKNKLFRKK